MRCPGCGNDAATYGCGGRRGCNVVRLSDVEALIATASTGDVARWARVVGGEDGDCAVADCLNAAWVRLLERHGDGWRPAGVSGGWWVQLCADHGGRAVACVGSCVGSVMTVSRETPRAWNAADVAARAAVDAARELALATETMGRLAPGRGDLYADGGVLRANVARVVDAARELLRAERELPPESEQAPLEFEGGAGAGEVCPTCNLPR